MEKQPIEGFTRELNKPRDWDDSKGACGSLQIKDVAEPYGNRMESQWQPSPHDIEKIICGANVELSIVGEVHPPVAVGTTVERDFAVSDNAKLGLLRIMPILMADPDLMAAALDAMVAAIHQGNVDAGWWSDLETGKRKERNVGEMLMLMVTELSEGFEGHRKNLPDTHLPHFPMITVEMADTFIRKADFCGGLGLSFGSAVVEKLAYNKTRQDHSIEARKGQHGKKI